MSASDFVKLARLRSADALRERLDALGVELPLDETIETGEDAPLARPFEAAGRTIGNRFTILPMEGWDGTPDGLPTDRVRRRWRRFGESGAKLIWGGEAFAVSPEGRANPAQLMINEHTVDAIGALRRELVDTHEQAHGRTDDLCAGLQLTHSGRWARPDGSPKPRVAYRHAILDGRVAVEDDAAVLSDSELDALARLFVDAAALAARAGFHFVDVKQCHGYLGHELLSAVGRPGPYGGDLAGRSRFLRQIIEQIRSEVPEIAVAVRLSAFDFTPYRAGADGRGEPESPTAGAFVFGSDDTGLQVDLTETHSLLTLLEEQGVELICVTAGSPYYNPHIQRPAAFPPSDGYAPPEDPLIGVARLLSATRDLAAAHPSLTFVGSGYTYLQSWLPNVAQAAVRNGWVQSVGLGRMALSYPTMPADVLAGRALAKGLICRTFSDCTTAPRMGLVSGCYPLDEGYKDDPLHAELKKLKQGISR